MLLSKAIQGFLNDGLAGSYFPQTMRLDKMYSGMQLRYLCDCELEEITPDAYPDTWVILEMNINHTDLMVITQRCPHPHWITTGNVYVHSTGGVIDCWDKTSRSPTT